MKKLIIFIILLIAIESYIERDEEEGDIKEIDISSVYDKDDKVLLSEVADSISYISLETDSSCFIGKIRNPDKNIQFAKDRFFISDGDNLFSFENSGKFLFKIGRQGKGPGEYFRIDNFTVLNKQKLVVILIAVSCDRPVCNNKNPIFDKYDISSFEYKAELVRAIEKIGQKNLSYWFEGYAEENEKEYIIINIQNDSLCAKGKILVTDWNKMEGIKKSKGQGYVGA